MSKKFVTGASFALGGAGIVLVGYLSANPLAFTRPVAALPFESPRPSPVLQTIAAAPVIELVLPDVTISATVPRPVKAVAQPIRLEPCSDWIDVGATLIKPGGATGVHSVRLLCSESGPRAISSN